MKQKAVYPGTFDPVTNGHIDIIRRAKKIFPELVIAVANNQQKTPYFSLENRIALLKEAVQDLEGISILGFNNLLIDFVQEQKAEVILRGLRAASDFEYELQLAAMNRKLAPNIETIFLTPSEHLMFVSSTLVKEIAILKGDISKFVPSNVTKALNFKKN
jgi:pantetheine-phosphate adenylyltransferase